MDIVLKLSACGKTGSEPNQLLEQCSKCDTSERLAALKHLSSGQFPELVVQRTELFLKDGKIDFVFRLLDSLKAADMFLFEIATAFTQFINSYLSVSPSYDSVLREVASKIGLLSRAFPSSAPAFTILKTQMSRYSIKMFVKATAEQLPRAIEQGDLELHKKLYSVLTKHLALSRQVNTIIWIEINRWIDSCLLNPSKSTLYILRTTKHAVKILSDLDRSGVLLENFLTLTKAYLMKYRKDAYGKVVMHFIIELSETEPSFADSVKASIDSPDIDQRNFDCPMSGDIRASTRSGDIFSIMANLFNSTSEMVVQYKNVLAERISRFEETSSNMTQNDFINSLRVQLEGLKKKFVGSEWNECTVILFDLQLSVGLNSGPLHAFRISKLFWPNFEPTSFYTPSVMVHEQYRKIVGALKGKEGNKEFWFTNSFSRVDLELEFDNGRFPSSCSADEAAIIILLSESKFLSFPQICAMTGFAESRVAASLSFWVTKRVINVIEGSLIAVCKTFIEGPPVISLPSRWLTSSSSISTAIEVHVDIQRVFPLVCGVLSNLGPLPLGHIQTHLQKVSVGYRCQESDLHIYLQSQVSTGVLYLTEEGFYNVKRKI